METTTPSYEVDLEDERLEEVNDKWAGISDEVTDNYQGMIDQADSFYQGVQDAMDKSVEAQKQNQQALTDFTIEKIEQQKEQAHKDYVKEQSGAYKDWQKQSDRYGVNAEQMAASGMTNTGFSESSQVSMYNTYQNRVATAREALSQAMLNYDNNIKEAMLQNNSILAEIEADAAIKAAELALEGFQYKNSLILEQTNKKLELENMRSQEWYKMLEQINTENALAEDVRQFESSLTHEKDMLDAETQAEKDLWDYKNSNPASEEEDEVDKDDTDDEIDKEDAEDGGGEATFDKDEDEDEDEKADDATSDKDNADDSEYDEKVPVDIDSVFALGVGNLTEEELAALVAEDYVIMTIENGRYVFRWSVTKEAQKKKTQLENRNKDQLKHTVKTVKDELSGNYEVKTDYYRGKKNIDAYAYGTFDNGYQPKGIGGHGFLKDSGKTITFTTTTLSGENRTVTQKVWKAEDGTKWYWDGRYNKYIEYKPSSAAAVNATTAAGRAPSNKIEEVMR